MSEADPEDGKGVLTLDHLVALNDEIAALARAGMPLERGLVAVGTDLRGRLGREMVSLADRLARGESLADAIEAEGGRFPRLYRALVEAGVRTGRLSVALEGLANFARRYAELRRAVGLAFWYPMLVLLAADGVFLLMAELVAPRLLAAFPALEARSGFSLRWLRLLTETVWVWAPLIPVFVVATVVAWMWAGRAASLQSGRSRQFLRFLPWAERMLANAEAAIFAELLALLLDHDIPYARAMVLAAEASGDPALVASCARIAAALEGGSSPAQALEGPTSLPPLLRWVLATGSRQGSVEDALWSLAAHYRKVADRQAEQVRLVLPTLLLIAIGGTVTLAYALTFFVPLIELFEGLAAPR